MENPQRCHKHKLIASTNAQMHVHVYPHMRVSRYSHTRDREYEISD